MPAHWMLYSHDALGLGHVRRMLAIANAVLPSRPDLSALLVTCSPQVDALPIPPGLDYIKLPSARKLTAQQYVARTLRLDSNRLREMRSALLLDTARTFAPDLLLVDKSPLGLMSELADTLALLRESSRASRLVLGWRDILDAPDRVRAEWASRRTLETIERWYDEVWIYGDPDVFDARIEYAMPDGLAERVRFLGYLAPPVDPAARARVHASLAGDGPVALVTAGGGEDGEALLSTWIEAARGERMLDGMRSVVVTGPMMPLESQRRLRAIAPPSVTVMPFVSGLESWIAAADVVVSMAGYNTVCEALGAGTPLVLSPRASQRDEQRLRAQRLAARGWVECVESETLTPHALAEASVRALARGRRPEIQLVATPGHDGAPALDGLARVALNVDRLLPSANGVAPARIAGWSGIEASA